MGPFISVNLSLELPTEVSLECLYGLAGHPRVPSPDTANSTERFVGRMGSTMTSWSALYIACLKKSARPLASSAFYMALLARMGLQ